MYTFNAFFGWPMGAVWGNLLASILVAVWVTVQSRSIKALQAEVRDMHEKHHADHMDALSLETPGGLAAVMSAANDAKSAAESAHGAVQGLALVAAAPKPAATATGATRMRKTAAVKPETPIAPTPAAEAPVKAPVVKPSGMGSRVTPKTTRRKT